MGNMRVGFELIQEQNNFIYKGTLWDYLSVRLTEGKNQASHKDEGLPKREPWSWDSNNSRPEIWQNKDVPETHFKSCISPLWILYLAIYGFFLRQEESGSSEHPLILAGLTLASANAVNRAGKLSSAGEDSTLYILEVQSLNRRIPNWSPFPLLISVAVRWITRKASMT